MPTLVHGNISLESQHLGYEYIDYKTLLIFQGVPHKSVKLSGVIWRDGAFGNFVEQIAKQDGFEVVLEDKKYESLRVNIEMNKISLTRGFEAALSLQGLTYRRVGCDQVVIMSDKSILIR